MFKLNTTKKNLSLGARGEKSSIKYLKSLNYTILETNFCNDSGRRLGEIDIIAKDGEEIVFIEVKTRINNPRSNFLPEENINRSKLYKMSKVASFYISKNNLFEANYRFDAISVVADPEKNTAAIKHLKSIFL